MTPAAGLAGAGTAERASHADAELGRGSIVEGVEETTVRGRLLWLIGARLLVATLLLGGTTLIAGDPKTGFEGFTPRILSLLIAATYGVSLLFALWLSRGGAVRALAFAQLAWDLALTTGLIYVSGGVASGFTFLYGIEVLMAALVVGPRASLFVAASALVLYSVLGITTANGWLPHPPDQPLERYVLSPEATGFALLSNIVGLVLVTALASTLATRLRRTGGQLRRVAESAKSLARLNDDIVRSLSSGLLTTDLDGLVLSANPAAADTFRTRVEDLVGTSLDTLIPDAARAPTRGRGECEARRPTGGAFPVGFTQTALLDEGGTVTGRLLTFQDLTEIRRLRELAQRSERLTALGRLAVGLAHEIRNPLSSISGSVELVREGHGLADEDRQLLGVVLTEVDRLDELVQAMLLVGRGREVERTRCDLQALLEEVAKVAERDAAVAGNVQIVRGGGGSTIEALVDPDQLRQVVWNLLKNALQASPVGGVVTLAAGRGEDGSAWLSVRDQGPGVPAAERERLFETFYSGRPHGVGLGLTVVAQIVEAHGGHVEVDSPPEGGAVFRVVLPPPPSDEPSGPPGG